MPTITLTNNDDVLDLSGDANDTLVDTILALDGNDTIIGSNDDDLIYGGNGTDSLSTGQGVNQIFAGDGDDIIDNFFTAADGGPATGGSLVDTLDGGLGNDSIIGSQGDDVIYGGDGADTINSNFGVLFDALGLPTGGDTVYGGAGDDVITTDGPGSTSSVRDTVYGGLGNDSIVGAIDSTNAVRDLDSLFGGAGNDTIDGNGGEDSIDAGDGNDLVIARDQVDTTTGGAGIDTIDFSNESGSVVFDMGTGATNADGDVEQNTLYENAIGSTESDTITGSTADNSIDGGLGNDSLIGGGGSDTFVSGGGNDTIAGSEDAGDTDIDVLDYSNEAADITVTYDGDESGTVTGVSTGTDTFSEIERIIFTNADDNVNAAADTVGVTLDTQGGNDFVRAGQGDDSMDGGADIDRLSYIDSTSPVTIDIEAGTASGAGTGNDTFANFEEFTLTTGDDSAVGSSGNDSIDANAGNDVVDAGAGDDTVIAGDGNDTVAGGAGADSLNGGAGFDTLDYSNSSAPVTVDLAAKAVTGGDATGDTIFSFEAVTGSAGGDNLLGDGGANVIDGGDGDDAISTAGGDDSAIGGAGNDAIDAGAGTDTTDGGSGNDVVQAGAGNDTHDGGADIDTIEVDDATGPVVIDLANDTLTGAGVGNDVILNFENATGTANNDDIIGDGGDNTLDGGDGNDTVDGGDGNDSVTGGGGNDTVEGGGGNDTVDGGDGSDSLDGGDGNDTLDGGAGDDDIAVGSGDSAFGGGGDDEFFIDGDTLIPGSNITITGGETEEGDPSDTTNNPGDGDPAVLVGDEIIINTPTGGSFIVDEDPTDPEAGQVFILDNGGNTISTITYSEIEAITCFTRGTMIMTPNGEVAIEDLSEGDLVMTRDRGAQQVRWIGSQTVAAEGKLAPVMIREGALGNDRDLLVSPLHRMLIEDWRAELMFGETEVLAAAKHLINGDTIHVQEGGDVEYFHMLFDSHEIVTANGAASESFHPGEQGIGWMAEEVREEIFEIFPQLRVEIEGYGPAARTSLKAYEVRALKR
ncbi:MAG: Hint domain-containing protein [Pseudomonadota bacterium]